MSRLQLSIIAVLLFVFGFIMLQAGKQTQLAAMRHTYSVCWHSHTVIDGRAEIACGDAQDATHTEFVCGQVNCWLEVK